LFRLRPFAMRPGNCSTSNRFGISSRIDFFCCKRWMVPRLKTCSAVVARGGLLRSLDGGTYLVNRQMLDDARKNLQGEHAANLGCALADDVAREYECPAYVVDPVSVNEFEPLAKYSVCLDRAAESIARVKHSCRRRRAAEEMRIPFLTSQLIVCHLGGGILLLLFARQDH